MGITIGKILRKNERDFGCYEARSDSYFTIQLFSRLHYLGVEHLYIT